jgi:hypothetical protein
MINVKSLPIQHCDSSFCITQARYWDGRIVIVGDPGNTIIGWCPVCVQFVCSRCCLQVSIPYSDWKRLAEFEQIQALYKQHQLEPAALQCKRCGSFLGKYSDILVWERVLK